MSKVQNSQPEITKDEVQSTIKILHAHKCYDPAGLKNEVFKSGGDSFLNLITKMLNCILKENKETIKQLTNILKYLKKLFTQESTTISVIMLVHFKQDLIKIEGQMICFY